MMRRAEGGKQALLAGVVACAQLWIPDCIAQAYPVKPIRMIVGFAAGGGTDVTARMVAQKLTASLGQPVVVENRPGAAGSLSLERVATSPADGYTLLMMSSSSILESALRAKSYDLERDFAPVSLVTIGPFVLVVHPSVPARNVKELIALARSRPGALNYGSSGVGANAHLATELFCSMASVKLVHVPYKGGAESAIATAAGHVDTSFASVTSALPLLKAEKVRPLAVTSMKRVSLMPAIPTVDESGLRGYDRSTWYSMLAPAGVPRDIIARLNAEIGRVIHAAEMIASLNKQGLEPQASTPERLAALIRSELADNAKLIKLAGLKAE